MNCKNYDAATAESSSQSEADSPPKQLDLSRFSGSFDPGADALEIRYRNFRGEEQTYRGDRRTLRRRGAHISVCLAPTGRRATFALQWVVSPQGLEAAAEQAEAAGPSPGERRVLSYHKKRGSTSALYEKLHSKYPKL